MDYFKEVRQRIEDTYRYMISRGVKHILLWGDGEIAELCYISTRGLPLNIVGVVGASRVENGLFGHPIYSPQDIEDITYDAILIASLEDTAYSSVRQLAVDHSKVYFL